MASKIKAGDLVSLKFADDILVEESSLRRSFTFYQVMAYWLLPPGFMSQPLLVIGAVADDERLSIRQQCGRDWDFLTRKEDLLLRCFTPDVKVVVVKRESIRVFEHG